MQFLKGLQKQQQTRPGMSDQVVSSSSSPSIASPIVNGPNPGKIKENISIFNSLTYFIN